MILMFIICIFCQGDATIPKKVSENLHYHMDKINSPSTGVIPTPKLTAQELDLQKS